jgi:hypothetical protein
MLRKKTTKLKSKPPLGRRRRSLSNIPINTINAQRHVAHDPQKLRYDRMSHVPLIERPTDRKARLPSLQKFVAGRSSLWSIASAVSRLEQGRRDVKAKMAQSFPGAWFMNDKKQLLNEMNEGSRSAPPLPASLSVHLRICRSQVCQLVDEDFESFRYKDLPHVYVFFKTSSKSQNQEMPLHIRAAKCTLKNSTVVLWVGAHEVAGLNQRSGLGSLYLATGKEMSGRGQLLLRVKNREGKGNRRRRLNGTIEMTW